MRGSEAFKLNKIETRKCLWLSLGHMFLTSMWKAGFYAYLDIWNSGYNILYTSYKYDIYQNVHRRPSCKLNGVMYARYWLLRVYTLLYIGLLSNLFNIAPSWGWGGRGWGRGWGWWGDVYIRERGYLSVHCLVRGHGPGPGTLAAVPMHALSWTLEAALAIHRSLGQCTHADT